MHAAVDLPKFDLTYGSLRGVAVEVLAWEVHPGTPELAIVKACSCVTVGTRIDAELMQYLLSENRRMRFGAFQLETQIRSCLLTAF